MMVFLCHKTPIIQIISKVQLYVVPKSVIRYLLFDGLYMSTRTEKKKIMKTWRELYALFSFDKLNSGAL